MNIFLSMYIPKTTTYPDREYMNKSTLLVSFFPLSPSSSSSLAYILYFEIVTDEYYIHVCTARHLTSINPLSTVFRRWYAILRSLRERERERERERISNFKFFLYISSYHRILETLSSRTCTHFVVFKEIRECIKISTRKNVSRNRSQIEY